MNPNLTLNIVNLRASVAFLGEKEQHNWWSSSFLSGSGEAFLTPVFPKTSLLSRVNGASIAAQLVHDEYIGVGDVFHLFRLPENIEHDISQLLVKDSSVAECFASPEEATAQLVKLAAGTTTQAVGPLLLEQNDIDEDVICQMASAYMTGFESNQSVYPYYRSNM